MLHVVKSMLRGKIVNAMFNFIFALSVVSHLHFFYPTHSFEITDIPHSKLCHPNGALCHPQLSTDITQHKHVLSTWMGQ